MNLRPPPPDVDPWFYELWEFLQNPVLETLRLNPRSPAADTEKGRMYYDSDTDKFMGYTGSYQEFGDIT